MKKKTAVIFLTGLMIFTMSGYFVNAADTSVKEENENSNILIAYFTVPGISTPMALTQIPVQA